MNAVERASGKRPWLVVAAWILVAAALASIAPDWNSIIQDGDFAFLPTEMPSVQGERMVAQAFPTMRAKSQIAILVAREEDPLTSQDRDIICADIGRRIQFLQGTTSLAVYQESPNSQHGRLALEVATQAFGKARQFDSELRAAAGKQSEAIEITPLVATYEAYAEALRHQDKLEEAKKVTQEVETLSAENEPLELNVPELPFSDVWSWRDRFFGKRLGQNDRHFRLMVIQLSTEFMATENIRVVEVVQRELDAVKNTFSHLELPRIALTGSAVVGADMLNAAKTSVSQTEVVTVILVISILILVYRAPFLVLIPLISIGLALVVSNSLIAILVQAGEGAVWHWKVFPTTRIFIVVILFGAGTDYCLFLIARYREEINQDGARPRAALDHSRKRVARALLASSMTTIVGLAMMYFAEFEKLRFSGPVIGFALLITVFVTLTFTPALLSLSGQIVFWPNRSTTGTSRVNVSRFWERLSSMVVRSPALVMFVCLAAMSPFFIIGLSTKQSVSYDVLASLPHNSSSRQGMSLLTQFIPVGENGPITIVCHRESGELASAEGQAAIARLASELYAIPHVKRIRTLYDPLGELGPDQKAGVLTSKGFGTHLLRAHRRVRTTFVTEQPGLRERVARFDVVLGLNPFSLEAIRVLDKIEGLLADKSTTDRSFWKDTQFSFAGTTAGIRDLRNVTRTDHLRIELLVVIAVSIVLLVLLKDPWVCLYMILTILFTYYVTMGATHLLFSQTLGEAYLGLDWKVPLFVFVILVAVGQDYNVYLASRVQEEQQRSGPFRGLQTAIVNTGGIISSCGLIMAGTFFSMTSGAWRGLVDRLLPGLGIEATPTLMSIVQLGFALSLGICLDTFVVRPILLPACLSLSQHLQRR